MNGANLGLSSNVPTVTVGPYACAVAVATITPARVECTMPSGAFGYNMALTLTRAGETVTTAGLVSYAGPSITALTLRFTGGASQRLTAANSSGQQSVRRARSVGRSRLTHVCDGCTRSRSTATSRRPT